MRKGKLLRRRIGVGLLALSLSFGVVFTGIPAETGEMATVRAEAGGMATVCAEAGEMAKVRAEAGDETAIPVESLGFADTSDRRNLKTSENLKNLETLNMQGDQNDPEPLNGQESLSTSDEPCPALGKELLGYAIPIEEDAATDRSTSDHSTSDSTPSDRLTPAATKRYTSDQETVRELIMAKQKEYPEEMGWTNDNYYDWKGGIYSRGYGCAGFAFLLSDAAFDDAKAKKVSSVKFSSVRIGDILRVNNDTHSVIVTDVSSSGVVLAEGNYNSSIHWGRTMTSAEVEKADYLLTRYADDPGSGGEDTPVTVSVGIYAAGIYPNWDGVTNVAQFKGPDGKLWFAVDSENTVKVYKTDENGNIYSAASLAKQHPTFGTAICDSDGNYYLVTGEENKTDDTSVETVFISKYDSSGKHIMTTGDNGGSSLTYDDGEWLTKTPFYGGNCDAAIQGNILTVNYARLMYSGHQSNSVLSVNTDDMTKFNMGMIYQSHSFAQRVVPVGNGFVYLSEGDCYERAFVSYTAKLQNGNDPGLSKFSIFDFWVRDGALDDYDMYDLNDNFAHMGGVTALSDGRVAFASQSVRSLSSDAKKEAEDIFIQIYDPSADLSTSAAYTTSGERSGLAGPNGRDQVTDYGVKWLTSYGSDLTVSDVQIASTDKDEIVVLFQAYKGSTYKGVYYIVLDKDGNVTCPATLFSATALLNPCEMPVYANGAVTWVGNKSGDNSKKVYVYSLDTNVTAAPVFSPEGGNYTEEKTVTISCSTEGAEIYYTTDGKAPNRNSTKYSDPILVKETTTIKAFAVCEGLKDSAVVEETYTIKLPATYTVSVADGSGSGNYKAGNSVKIKANDPPEGERFKEWKGASGLVFTEGNAATASAVFTMPERNVSLRAYFEKLPGTKYEVTVENGTGGGQFAAGDTVVVTAIEAPADKVFSGWTGPKEITFADHLAEKTSFVMPDKPVTVTAHFRDRVKDDRLWIDGLEESYVYTGAAIKPEIRVYDGEVKLTEGKDYSVGYKNNKNAGNSALMTISFKGNYKGTPKKPVEFKISPAALGEDVIALDSAVALTAKEQKPAPVFVMAETGKLINGKGFEFDYFNEDNDPVTGLTAEGVYRVKVSAGSGSPNYKGETEARITVVREKSQLLSGASVSFTPNSYVWTGEAIRPSEDDEAFSLKIKGKPLSEGVDYELKALFNNRRPGKALAVFTAVEGYAAGFAGCKTAAFTISKGRVLASPEDEGSDFTYVADNKVPYLKGGAKPEVAVFDGVKELVPGKDYTLKYAGNGAVTEKAIVTVTGKGFYKGSQPLEFEVVKQNLENLSGNLVVSDPVMSDKAKNRPAVTITDLNWKKLKEGTDYSISDIAEEPDKSGYYSILIEGMGNYEGKITGKFRYVDKGNMLGKVKAEKIAPREYTGSPVILADSDLKEILFTGSKIAPEYLRPGKDFEVVCMSNNLKAGTAKVTVRGLGSFGGTRTLQFKIMPKKGGFRDESALE